jgi:hypothetical protein
LSWGAIDGATEYELYRSTDGGKTYKLLKTTTKTSLTHTGAVAGNKYYYKVKAIHSKSNANSAYARVKYRKCDHPRPEVKISVQSGTHEELYRGLEEGNLDLALNDQRRAFSQAYRNLELKNADCLIELSARNTLSEQEKVDVRDLSEMSCIIVSSKEQQEIEAEYYRTILGFSSDFLFAETLEQARLLVIGNRGFLPMETIGQLPEVSGMITRIPLFRNRQRVQRKYCLFWKEEKTSQPIEEFAKMLRRRLISHK